MTDTDTAASNRPETVSLPLPDRGYARLTDRILVRVSGPGTDKFLQGQFSQHLDEVTNNRALRAAASNPKGRAYCLTRLARDGDSVVLDLPAALADQILAQLRKYLMLFRGTTMAPLEDGLIWGLLGRETASAIAGRDISGLESAGDTLGVDSGLLIRVESDDRGTERYEFWQTSGEQPEFGDAPELSLADWHATEIAAGIPALDEANWETFVPQMLNLQHLGGIHFKKGCYTGQEVIARMHFLGQLKKSLFRFRSAGSIAPGADIKMGERTVGSVVNQVAFEDGSVELLAVVRHDAAAQPLSADGNALTALPLPYAVPEREQDNGPDDSAR
ncbi:folate-binding protein [Marinobacter pelagius]|uniref:CAF17-like 4Fe-4S cluster assembly/insertion protein YgfZ n=1 Tax=Marinobacter sp. C7 TaxID=2951363 RepID=UPI001EEF9685|nr:folate-binding protein [Marinobacter sp. C7]MCG7201116.1 folate-binding protein [Marinobacter sp. C7]